MIKESLLQKIKFNNKSDLEEIVKMLLQYINDEEITEFVNKHISFHTKLINKMQRQIGALEYKVWKLSNPPITTVTTDGANLIYKVYTKIQGLLATSPWWRIK